MLRFGLSLIVIALFAPNVALADDAKKPDPVCAALTPQEVAILDYALVNTPIPVAMKLTVPLHNRLASCPQPAPPPSAQAAKH